MNTRLWAIIRKEFIHILRDRRTLAIMFAIPIIELVLLGYSATTDIRRLNTAVFDDDRSMQSRQLVDAYRASDYFAISNYVQSEDELAQLLDNGQVRAGIVIPAGYADNLAAGKTAQVAFLIDGSDPSVATTAFSAAQSVGQAFGIQILQQRLGIDITKMGTVEIRPRVWYNPELKSSNFMIPAVMGMILQFLSQLFTSLAIVREREQGTIEQLVVTPIKSWELIIGKIVPYSVIAFFDLLAVLVLGVVLFQVPIHGSVLLLLILSFLFLITTLGMGVLVSSVARSQQEAMFLTFLTILPAIFLGGFIFPLEAMPQWLQVISYVIPLRYMLIIMRAIIL